MKVVINNCYGGFSLSPKAVKWIADKQGKPCYFFQRDYVDGKSVNIRVEGFPIGWAFWTAFDVPDYPADADYKKHAHPYRYDCRHDPLLVQVVEELGEEANGSCAELKIVDIPDGTDYVISEYDGMEHVAERHRTWG